MPQRKLTDEDIVEALSALAFAFVGYVAALKWGLLYVTGNQPDDATASRLQQEAHRYVCDRMAPDNPIRQRIEEENAADEVVALVQRLRAKKH